MYALIISNSFITRTALQCFVADNLTDFKEVISIDSHQFENFNLLENTLLIIDGAILDDIFLNILDNLKSNFKIIVYSRNEDENLFRKCLNIGINGYIIDDADKAYPLGIEELKFAFNKVLSGKNYFDSDLMVNILERHDNRDIEDINFNVLTCREMEVLRKVQLGLSNKEISRELYIAESTAKKHISSLLNKLNMKNRKELICKLQSLN